MISEEQIKILAQRQQTTELNINREYYQHLFLSYFYQQPQSSQVYFKGGTALKVLYNSPRFSEDLDFSSTFSNIKDIEQAILDTLVQIQRENTKTVFQESKLTSGGYLGTIEFESSILILLQISLRQRNITGQVMTVTGDFVPAYTVVSLNQDQLVGEKLQALLERKKPRDFYDLYFMLRANLVSIEKRQVLKQALKVLKTTDINFEQELKEFLPKAHWALIRDFKKNLDQEINRFI